MPSTEDERGESVTSQAAPPLTSPPGPSRGVVSRVFESTPTGRPYWNRRTGEDAGTDQRPTCGGESVNHHTGVDEDVTIAVAAAANKGATILIGGKTEDYVSRVGSALLAVNLVTAMFFSRADDVLAHMGHHRGRDRAPPCGRGRTVGVFSSAAAVGFMLGQLSSGALIDAFPRSTVYLLVAGFAGCVAVACLFVPARPRTATTR